MFGTGILAGVLAKLAGLGSAAKVGVAATTAALTMTLAGGAAGVVALSGDSSPAATQAVAGQTLGVIDDTAPTTTAVAEVQADSEASASTPAASTPAAASTSAGVADPEASVPSVPVPSVPTEIPGLPDLSGLADLPAQVMACLDPVLDLVANLPAVSPGQISQLAQSIVACVSGIVSDLPLPFGMNACISQIMGFFGGLGSGLPTGFPSFANLNVGNLDLSVCIPSGLPVPTGMFTGFPLMNGGFGFGR